MHCCHGIMPHTPDSEPGYPSRSLITLIISSDTHNNAKMRSPCAIIIHLLVQVHPMLLRQCSQVAGPSERPWLPKKAQRQILVAGSCWDEPQPEPEHQFRVKASGTWGSERLWGLVHCQLGILGFWGSSFRIRRNLDA